MSPRVLEAFQIFQPAEKACWAILLREHIGDREISEEALAAAMDQTLTQLWALLRTHSAERCLKNLLAVKFPETHETGDCMLGRLLPFFSSGEHALELVGKELEWTYPHISGRERAELHLAFEMLVQCQLQALCAKCPRKTECRYGGRGKPTGVAKTTGRKQRLPGATGKISPRRRGGK